MIWPGLMWDLLGVSTIVISNDGTASLTSVRVEMIDGSLTTIAKEFPTIDAGSRESIRVRTSDLILNEFSFVLKGRTVRFSGGAIACKGEVLSVSVGSDGEVVTSHTR